MGARSRALRRPLEHQRCSSDKRCTDWSAADQAALSAFYRQECAWWVDRLDWDTEESWRQVELARQSGRLPGVAITAPGGRIEALGYCFLDDGVAQLGVSTTAGPAHEAVTRALLDHAARQGATSASYFGPQPHAAGVDASAMLARAGFDVERHQYLVCDLPDPGGAATTTAAWQEEDLEDVARLLQDSYGADGRHFAAQGRLDQWVRYVGNLVSYTGCGTFMPVASRVWRQGATVAAVALVTCISPGVAHLAQLAVHASARGQGVAGRLLDDAMAAAAAAGCRRMTLIVGDVPAAVRLYTTRGFVPREQFLAAWLPALRRAA